MKEQNEMTFQNVTLVVYIIREFVAFYIDSKRICRTEPLRRCGEIDSFWNLT